ncbi:hypothetical protein Pcinc_037060 [Petrolisthes cinctipes]|uniref:ZP domain-containing protein n=1 Tax=Petrolisthes cinctipes TaxID=88211 RepID=A0AAE1BT73_PETCI|nr:hypothetical protein Pcinc_037060 [Petrolisthes cinctipes]
MKVDVKFSLPFNGVIFSKGHYSNPACRYVEARSGRSGYTFLIPSEGCGSDMSEIDYGSSIGTSSSTRISNTIIVQNDADVQESKTDRRLSCADSEVPTRDVRLRPNQRHQRRRLILVFPPAPPFLPSSVPRDQRTQDVPHLHHLHLDVMKAPVIQDVPNLKQHLQGSTDPRCPKPTTPAPPRCFPGSSDPRCPKPKTTPAPPRCYTGSTDPRCPKPTTPAPPRCYQGSTDPRCPKPTTTPAPRCYEGSSDPRCPKPTTPAPPRCYTGSTDPRCPKPTTPSPPRCYKGSSDPRCPKPTTSKPICYPGSPDPRCPSGTSYKPEARPTPRPRPKPTTPDNPRQDSILFPATITTPRPTTTPRPRPRPTPSRPALKPRPTPTRKPNRGKQLDSAPQPKPEPTGKEWEGESRYHAFHSYHFQRGDGRRGRTFGARLSRSAEDADQETTVSRLPRSPRWVLMRRTPLEEETLYQHQSQPLQHQQQQQRINKIPVRLSRSVSVAAISQSDRSSVPYHAQPTAEAQTSTSTVVFPDPMETVCFPMAVFAAGMLSLLFLLLLSSTAALVLYIRKRDPYEDDKVWNTR